MKYLLLLTIICLFGCACSVRSNSSTNSKVRTYSNFVEYINDIEEKEEEWLLGFKF